MKNQQDDVTCIQVSNLEESNNGIHSGTTRETINPVSDKPQRCLKSAFESIKEIIDAQDLFLEKWYEIIFWMCVISLWLDPLFCYSLLINDDKKCVTVDKKLGTIAIVLRSVMDFLYVIHVIFKFCTGFSLPQAFGRGIVKGAWAITNRFLIDIISVLPLPQVVLLIIIHQDTGEFDAMKSLILIVFLQYMPRALRIYPLFITFTRTSGILSGSAWAKAAFNLFLYMLASHVVGAFWYLSAVARKTMCWQEACKSHTGCVRLSCENILGDYTFLTDSCPIKTPNTTIFNFGIFLEALDSGIVDSTDFFWKFSYSFWFGLQSLSSLGQSLKTSTYVVEIFYAVIISLVGLVLFAFLVGNMQTYLQSKTARLEEMRLKGQEIDQWMAFHSLPRNLKKRIRKYQQYKWKETRGVDVENLLYNLPRDIRRDTKRHLFSNVLNKVPLFQNVDEKLSDTICDHLKQVFYMEHSCIVREDDPLDEMLFITRGKLLTHTRNGGRSFLEKGNLYGEELFDWALSSPSDDNIPFSTKTVHAHTKVEAFVLTANDLKNIVSKFMSHFGKEQLKHRAASVLQKAWRCYHMNKLEAAQWRQVSRERIPPTLPQQPAEHDIVDEQQ